MASSGAAFELLQRELPNARLLQLPGYNVRYPFRNMLLNMALQGTQVVQTIRAEHRILQKWVQEYRLDAIISDNRFGCWSPYTYNIILTHQIHLMAPGALAQWVGRRINYRMLAQFDACWAPDWESEPNLSGALSHGGSPPLPVTYIGPLSRMKKLERPVSCDLLAVLSGPEPQRSYLEEKLLVQLKTWSGTAHLVRGIPKDDSSHELKPGIQVSGHLTAQALNACMSSAGLIISRSGYSTLMDLASIQKPAVLIPTPGQTEQIYLAERLQSKGIFPFQTQDRLDIRQAWDERQLYPGFSADLSTGAHPLSKAVSSLLSSLA